MLCPNSIDSLNLNVYSGLLMSQNYIDFSQQCYESSKTLQGSDKSRITFMSHVCWSGEWLTQCILQLHQSLGNSYYCMYVSGDLCEILLLSFSVFSVNYLIIFSLSLSFISYCTLTQVFGVSLYMNYYYT